MKRFFVVSFLILTFYSIDADAANWYVRPSGGGGTGTSWTNAWNGLDTINWTTVSCGDTIWVAGGTYSGWPAGWLKPQKNCTSGSQLYIRRARSDASACTGAAGWNSSFDSEVLQRNGSISFDGGKTANNIIISGRTNGFGNGYGWRIYNTGTAPISAIKMNANTTVNYLTFEYMEIEGPNISEWTGDSKAIYNIASGTSSGNHTFSRMKIHGWGTGIFLNYTSNHVVEYIDMYNIKGNATEHANLMYIKNSNNSIVRYSKFHDSVASGSGIAFSDGGPFANWQIYGNLFYDMNTGTATAIGVQQAAITGLKIFNNTFSNNAKNLYLSGSSCSTGTESRNNIVHGTGGSVDCGTTSNNLTTTNAGIFLNRATGDFRIVSTVASGYPRNAGTSSVSSYFTKDMDGIPFDSNGTWDIGAYGFKSGEGIFPASVLLQ